MIVRIARLLRHQSAPRARAGRTPIRHGYRIGQSALAALGCVVGMSAATIPAGQSRAQDAIQLVIGTAGTDKQSHGLAMRDLLKPALERRSDGRFDVQVHMGGTLCSEHGCVEQMRLGQVDIATVSSGNVGAFGTTFDIINLPYLFKDTDSAYRILNGWMAEELRARGAKDMDAYVLAVIPVGGFRQVPNNVREVRVPDDLKGIKLRVTKSPTEFSLIKAWGGIPVPYDWSQLYQGLQTGVVNGMYLQDVFTSTSNFTEVIKYITHTGGAWSAHPILMDRKRFDRLPTWGQSAVAAAGSDLQKGSFDIDRDFIRNGTEGLAQKVRIYDPTPAEMELWYAGAIEAWKTMKGKYDATLARRALEEQGQAELLAKLEKAGAL